jgi:histidyl-tRNA synthetase
MFGETKVLEELSLLTRYLQSMNIHERVILDTSLARGLDYYTGMIFEAVIVGGPEAKMGLGSIAAGGRYDELIGMFNPT